MPERVNKTIYKNERIISLSLDLKSMKISCIMVYASQQGWREEEKEEFYVVL